MKFYNMIKVGDKYNTEPKAEPKVQEPVIQTVESPANPQQIYDDHKEEIVNEISNMRQQLYGDIQNLFKNYTPEEAPPGLENTELNDNEIQDVLSTLLKYQEQYFSETPLSKELVQAFVWNIPHQIYDAHKDAIDRCKPDMMDPIYWFYLFCMKNPTEAMGKYIAEAINAMEDEDYDTITKYADEYDEM